MAVISETTFLFLFFWNERFCILIRVLLNFVPKDSIYNKSALAQLMACLFGAKSLPETKLTQITDT